MIGRKVSSAWHRLTLGEVIDWEPLGAGMCDVLVRESDGHKCWYPSSDLVPADDLGPLPSRGVMREWARMIAIDNLHAIREQHIRDFYKPWPGAEYGKAIMGRTIDGAILELKK